MNLESSGREMVADVGGTNVRFGVTTGDGGLAHRVDLKCASFASLADAIGAYVASLPGDPPSSAAIAVAAAVSSDRIEMTNNPWSFSLEETRSALGFERLLVLNDFEALECRKRGRRSR